MLNCTASTFSSRRVLYGQVWALLLMLGLLIPAQAAEALKPDALPQAQATLERLEQQLATAQTATAQELKTLKKEIATVRSTALCFWASVTARLTSSCAPSSAKSTGVCT